MFKSKAQEQFLQIRLPRQQQDQYPEAAEAQNNKFILGTGAIQNGTNNQIIYYQLHLTSNVTNKKK
jgi:hypothetical protein